jgi:hypothetical protein
LPEDAAAVAQGGFERQASGIVARLAISSLAAADKPTVSARLILPPSRPDVAPPAVLGVVVVKAQASAA